jgi:hypothetical protein
LIISHAIPCFQLSSSGENIIELDDNEVKTSKFV